MVKILLLKFVAKEIKKFVHLEELFTDLLKVVYKVARLPIQVLNIDKRIQHFFLKNLRHNMLGVSTFDTIHEHDTDFYGLNLIP